MPCPSKGLPRVPGAKVTDLLQIHPFTAGVEFQPRNKAELVNAVATSARRPRSLRALGANWSLSDAAVADDVVCTDALQFHLCQPHPTGRALLAANRLRDGGSDFLMKVLSADGRAVGRHFVHVEAGVKIRQLLLDLKACGLALPTMGAGAGQSLAGALATGTHGADIEVPPLVEWIRAVHLVGPGGQEWWITPEVSVFSTEQVLKLQNWCDDARMVANDNAFDAVRVGVGRMGVIYSMILEVVPAYGLIEVNLEHRWSEIRPLLGTSRVSPGNVTGVFDTPLRDLESGWFRSEVLARTQEVFSLFHRHSVSTFRYVGGPSRHVEPGTSPEKEKHYREMLASLGLGDLALDLRRTQARRLHHLNIAINLARPDQCWVTRRWRLQGPVRSVHLERKKPDGITQAVIKNKRNPVGMVKVLQKEMTPDNLWGQLTLTLGRLVHARQAQRFDEFINVDIPRIARESKTSGETLFMVVYKLATDPILAPVSRQVVIDKVSQAIGGEFAKLLRAGLATDILDTHNYDLDGGQSVNSGEFFFDASAGEYPGFIDEVIILAQRHSPVFGAIGIRFTPRATPLIAMQRFALTVSVEVATGRARQEDVYREFWKEVHAAASKRGAIPHWGQEFRQSARAIMAHYGEDLLTWRRMLAELSIDASNTFSTQFSRDKGLEPTHATGIFDSDSIDQFLAGLEAAND
jgi:hypothetical protein